jgi:TonB family protein
MIPPLLRLANAAVRLWTRVYTWRVPPPMRDARREEIESDLWESEHDQALDGRLGLSLRVFARLLIGIPDDLGWRVEQVRTMERSMRFRIALLGGVAGVLALWLAVTSSPTQLPTPPASPFSRIAVSGDPPPPPPPAPVSIGAPTEIQWTYGRTSYTVRGNLKRPARIKDVRPVYPPIAVANDVRGVVVVEATIDERGHVADARVAQSSGMLNQSAIDAVRQWEFERTMVNGAPVQVTIVVRVDFTP